MESDYQIKAREWLDRRQLLLESQDKLRLEYGILTSERSDSISPDSLPEPLRSEVLLQMAQSRR